MEGIEPPAHSFGDRRAPRAHPHDLELAAGFEPALSRAVFCWRSRCHTALGWFQYATETDIATSNIVDRARSPLMRVLGREIRHDLIGPAQKALVSQPAQRLASRVDQIVMRPLRK